MCIYSLIVSTLSLSNVPLHFNRIKIPCIIGTCFCDHLTPIWRWAYCVLECWVCRFTFCPKRERGEVWLVNRTRACRRRPGFFCFNKEDPYWLGEYSTYFLITGIGLVMWYLELHNCDFKGIGPSAIIKYISSLIAKKNSPPSNDQSDLGSRYDDYSNDQSDRNWRF